MRDDASAANGAELRPSPSERPLETSGRLSARMGAARAAAAERVVGMMVEAVPMVAAAVLAVGWAPARVAALGAVAATAAAERAVGMMVEAVPMVAAVVLAVGWAPARVAALGAVAATAAATAEPSAAGLAVAMAPRLEVHGRGGPVTVFGPLAHLSEHSWRAARSRGGWASPSP